jgi:curved DNA-binding protein CbpA
MSFQYGFDMGADAGFDFGGQGTFSFESAHSRDQRERARRNAEESAKRAKREREERQKADREREERARREREQARGSYRCESHWETLGVPYTATAREIRSAWARLCKQHHPDLHGGSGDMLKKINRAYEALKRSAR